jgi:hypothetical protein
MRQLATPRDRPTSRQARQARSLPRVLDGRSQGLAKLAESEWISLALACLVLTRAGIRDAAQLLQRAWEQGTLCLRGIRQPEPEPVEIPAYRPGDGVIFDCRNSSLSSAPRNRWAPIYQNVEARTADVERLDREAREAAAPDGPPPTKALPSSALLANLPMGVTERQKSDTLAEALASELHHQYPAGRPAMRRAELRARMLEVAGDKLGVFELTTLDRAMRLLGWTTRRPKAAKPRQPSR